MAHENLEGLKVAILVDDGFEHIELIALFAQRLAGSSR